MEYPSLDTEVRVGKTYLRTFLEGGDAFISKYDEPIRFFDLLMRRVLVNFGDKPDLATICAQCLERLYRLHSSVIGVFDDTLVLCDLISETEYRPLRHALLVLVLELVQRDDNTEQILTEKVVLLMCDLASFAHTNAKTIGSKLQRKLTDQVIRGKREFACLFSFFLFVHRSSSSSSTEASVVVHS